MQPRATGALNVNARSEWLAGLVVHDLAGEPGRVKGPDRQCDESQTSAQQVAPAPGTEMAPPVAGPTPRAGTR